MELLKVNIMKIKELDSKKREQKMNEIIKLMFRVYVATNAGYPKLEWLPKEVKPKVDEKDSFKKFKFYYEPFLGWRLQQELDEVYVVEDNDRIIGIIGLNYRVPDKYVPWVPREYLNRHDVGFIELFAVDPSYQGKGIGSLLFDRAISRLKELCKKPLLVTFPDLEALKFYKKKGGKVVKQLDKYVVIQF